MPLVLDIALVADRYDAGGGLDPRTHEWPPHPARVFSALRSVAEPGAETDSLRGLERLGAPTVIACAPQDVSPAHRRGYVVLNARDAKGGNLTYPGRGSGLRQRSAAFPRSSRVLMIWPDVPERDAHLIDDLARRVPYLGRATSAVLMSATARADAPGAPDGLVTYSPSATLEADLVMRVPYAGFTDELEALHDAGLSAWQATDSGRAAQGYRYTTEAAPGSPAVRSPYQDLVALRFSGLKPEVRLITRFTSALRSHVLNADGDPLPATVHGHGADGVPHVAFIGLPVVGHAHADGHLVGLGVAIPGLSAEDRRALVRRILHGGSGEIHVHVNGIGSVVLVHRTDLDRPRAADPRSWTRPSRRWVSVTPVVLDRYPKDRDLVSAVRTSCELAGLPVPLGVEVSKTGLTPGAARLRPSDLPKRATGRLYCHARLTFEQEVVGPVLVGAGRYLGVGLFAPERSTEVHDAADR
ncbi:hypothetical protein GCM10027062_32550 [Nocardioides hungaricus]